MHIVKYVFGNAIDLVLRGPEIVDEACHLCGRALRGGDESDIRGEDTEGEGEDAENVGSSGESAVIVHYKSLIAPANFDDARIF